jgi:RNA polymerase sigma factor (sigma-70 family)
MTSQDTVTGLVVAARDGDSAAWNALVERYLPLVVSVARRYRLRPDEVADVSQTLWLRLVEHLAEIRQPEALPGWIVTTTRNEALRFLKSRNRMNPIDPLNSAEFESADQSEVDEEVLKAERRQALRDGIAELRPQHRELLLLLLADPPLSYDEISQRLGIPKGSIGPTRARCLEQLRRTSALRSFVPVTDPATDPTADRS